MYYFYFAFIVIFCFYCYFLLFFYCFYCFLLSFIVFCIFFVYFLHILCCFCYIFFVFLLLFPFLTWKNQCFFEKFTFPMCYDRFELFFDVKSSYMHIHVLAIDLSVFLLRFFRFRCFFFRNTVSIYSIILGTISCCLLLTSLFFFCFICFCFICWFIFYIFYILYYFYFAFIVIFCFYCYFLLFFYCFYCFLLSFIVFCIFFVYFLHILCCFCYIFFVFLLLFPFLTWKNQCFFEKFTFPMCYDRFELFFDVKSSYMHIHVLAIDLSVFLLRFFRFRCFFFRNTVSIYSIILGTISCCLLLTSLFFFCFICFCFICWFIFYIFYILYYFYFAFIVIFCFYCYFLLFFYCFYCFLLSFIVFCIFFVYFLHILCCFCYIFFVFLLLFPFLTWKNQCFFEKFTFPMCYDRFELFFDVKSSYMHIHVLAIDLSVFLLRFFRFRCFFFRNTVSIYSIILGTISCCLLLTSLFFFCFICFCFICWFIFYIFYILYYFYFAFIVIFCFYCYFLLFFYCFYCFLLSFIVFCIFFVYFLHILCCFCYIFFVFLLLFPFLTWKNQCFFEKFTFPMCYDRFELFFDVKSSYMHIHVLAIDLSVFLLRFFRFRCFFFRNTVSIYSIILGTISCCLLLTSLFFFCFICFCFICWFIFYIFYILYYFYFAFIVIFCFYCYFLLFFYCFYCFLLSFIVFCIFFVYFLHILCCFCYIFFVFLLLFPFLTWKNQCFFEKFTFPMCYDRFELFFDVKSSYMHIHVLAIDLSVFLLRFFRFRCFFFRNTVSIYSIILGTISCCLLLTSLFFFCFICFCFICWFIFYIFYILYYFYFAFIVIFCFYCYFLLFFYCFYCFLLSFIVFCIFFVYFLHILCCFCYIFFVFLLLFPFLTWKNQCFFEKFTFPMCYDRFELFFDVKSSYMHIHVLAIDLSVFLLRFFRFRCFFFRNTVSIYSIILGTISCCLLLTSLFFFCFICFCFICWFIFYIFYILYYFYFAFIVIFCFYCYFLLFFYCFYCFLLSFIVFCIFFVYFLHILCCFCYIFFVFLLLFPFLTWKNQCFFEKFTFPMCYDRFELFFDVKSSYMHIHVLAIDLSVFLLRFFRFRCFFFRNTVSIYSIILGTISCCLLLTSLFFFCFICFCFICWFIFYIFYILYYFYFAFIVIFCFYCYFLLFFYCFYCFLLSFIVFCIFFVYFLHILCCFCYIFFVFLLLFPFLTWKNQCFFEKFTFPMCYDRFELFFDVKSSYMHIHVLAIDLSVFLLRFFRFRCFFFRNTVSIYSIILGTISCCLLLTSLFFFCFICFCFICWFIFYIFYILYYFYFAFIVIFCFYCYFLLFFYCFYCFLLSFIVFCIFFVYFLHILCCFCYIFFVFLLLFPFLTWKNQCFFEKFTFPMCYDRFELFFDVKSSYMHIHVLAIDLSVFLLRFFRFRCFFFRNTVSIYSIILGTISCCLLLTSLFFFCFICFCFICWFIFYIFYILYYFYFAFIVIFCFYCYFLLFFYCFYCFLLSFIVFCIFFVYFLHILCCFCYIFFVFLLLFPFLTWKNQCFFEKFTFPMCYDRFELFFDVKSSYMHIHVLAIDLSVFLLRFFRFRCFFFRNTVSIYSIILGTISCCLLLTSLFFFCFICFCFICWFIFYIFYILYYFYFAFIVIFCFYCYFLLFFYCFYCFLLSFIVFCIFFVYFLHILCCFCYIFFVFLLLFPFLTWKNQCFFEKFTFPMCYDRFELFFDVKSSYMHIHVLAIDLSVFLLRFFRFRCFFFRNTVSIYSIILGTISCCLLLTSLFFFCFICFCFICWFIFYIFYILYYFYFAFIVIFCFYCYFLLFFYCFYCFLLSFIVFCIFFVYFLHILCCFCYIFFVFLLLFPFLTWKNQCFFEKFTFPMCYDRFELFFDVKSSYMHIHVLAIDLSVFLLRFFRFRCFFFRNTVSIYSIIYVVVE